MLSKINLNGVVITNTVANTTNGSESTTLKIDSINLEEECKAEEIKELIQSVTSMLKEVITAKKKNTRTTKKNTSKRFHIVKTHDFPNGNGNILWYIWDRKTNSHYIKVGNTSADIMSASYFKQSIDEHKYAHRVIAEYDCNNFRL